MRGCQKWPRPSFSGDQNVSLTHTPSERPQGNRPHARMGGWVSAVTGLKRPRQPALTHSYLDARGSEIGDLELDTDGRLALLVFGLHTGKTKVGPHEVLLATLGSQRRRRLGSYPAARPQAGPWLPGAEAGQAVKGLHQLLGRDRGAAKPERPDWPWWEREPGARGGGGGGFPCTALPLGGKGAGGHTGGGTRGGGSVVRSLARPSHLLSEQGKIKAKGPRGL